jgi:hypothetical protein
MRDVSELSEEEAGWVKKLTIMYPEAFGYGPDKDPDVRTFAAELIEEGRVERVELPEGEGAPQVAYRITDDYAEEIREQAKEKGEDAQWN